MNLNINTFSSTSGSFTTSTYKTSSPNTYWYLELSWYVSATGSNYHTITATLTAKNTGELSSANYCYVFNYSATINGTTFASGTSSKAYHGKVLGTTTITISHTAEQSFSASAGGYWYGRSSSYYRDGSGSWTLPALITTPTLSWSSYSATSESTLSAVATVTSNGNASIVDTYIDVATDSSISNVVKTASSLSSAFSGLSANTTYYLRANASNGTYRGYSSVVSVTTWANPSVSSISAWTVGSSTTIKFNNSHSRTLYWYIKADSTSGTTLASGSTTGTSVTVTPDARTCWSTITSGYTNTAYLYFTCSNPSMTSGSATATYTLPSVIGGTMTITHEDATSDTYTLASTSATLTLGDTITLPIASNSGQANYTWFIETPDGSNTTYGDVDTSQSTTTQTISSDTIEEIVTSYFTATMSSDVAKQYYNVGIATLNANGDDVLHSDYYGYITLTNSQIQPTFSAWEYYDSNSDVTTITGDNQILIQNASYPALTISTDNLPTANYGASLSYIVITISDQSIKYTPDDWASTITYEYGDTVKNINGSQDAIVSVYDSRGAHTDVSQSLYIIPYMAPVDKTTVVRTNSFETETTISINGNYSSAFNEDGDTNYNDVETIQYQYKLATDDTYGDAITISSFEQSEVEGLNQSTYTVDDIINSSTFDNNYQYDIKILITDTLGSTTTNIINLDKGVPILYINTTSENVGIGTRNETDEEYSLEVANGIYNKGSYYIWDETEEEYVELSTYITNLINE